MTQTSLPAREMVQYSKETQTSEGVVVLSETDAERCTIGTLVGGLFVDFC